MFGLLGLVTWARQEVMLLSKDLLHSVFDTLFHKGSVLSFVRMANPFIPCTCRGEVISSVTVAVVCCPNKNCEMSASSTRGQCCHLLEWLIAMKLCA